MNKEEKTIRVRVTGIVDYVLPGMDSRCIKVTRIIPLAQDHEDVKPRLPEIRRIIGYFMLGILGPGSSVAIDRIDILSIEEIVE